jgi:hypothetical protein
MGENEDKMKQAYSFFSGGTHVNREYIPHRFLGEGNEFVLGAVAMPDLQGVGEYIRWLVNLWFWFGAVASYTFHKQVVNEPEYQISYRTTAAKCQVVYTALVSKLATFGDT